MKIRAICGLILFAGMTVSAAAHDLFLVTEGSGAQGKVCARIGEHFPESMNAVPVNRIGLFRVHREMKTPETLTALEPEAKQTCAKIRLPGGNGTTRPDHGVVEMTVNPNFIRLSAKDFNEYIEGEDFKAVIAARKQKSATESEGRELYSRYAKLILPGSAGNKVLGHALEIVPERSPDKMKAGESLPVRVLFMGKPLAGVRVSAVYAGAKLEGHSYPINAETDSEGRTQLKIDRPGLWYVRLIHMVPAENDPEVDWRSYFATLTFEIPVKK
jgi:hypothetical protein